MAEPARPPALAPDAAARLAEFARACKAAARAVSLYPGGHPAIATTLGRLEQVSAALTQQGPYRVQVMADTPHRRRRGAGEAGCRDRRAGRTVPPPTHRRSHAESGSRPPSRGARCSCCSPAPPTKCAPTAGSSTCGRPPAARASRSKRSTTPRCCARSKAWRRPPSRSSRRRSQAPACNWTTPACACCSTSCRTRPSSRNWSPRSSSRRPDTARTRRRPPS